MKYRRVAIGVALVVIVVALVLWHRQRPSESPTAQATGSAGHVAAGRVPLAHDRPGRRVVDVVLLDGAAAPGVPVRIDDTAPVLSDASGRFDLGVQPIARHVVVSEQPRLATVGAGTTSHTTSSVGAPSSATTGTGRGLAR